MFVSIVWRTDEIYGRIVVFNYFMVSMYCCLRVAVLVTVVRNI